LTREAEMNVTRPSGPRGVAREPAPGATSAAPRSSMTASCFTRQATSSSLAQGDGGDQRGIRPSRPQPAEGRRDL
jgi:hypothetical protein